VTGNSVHSFSFHLQGGWYPLTYAALLAACLLLAYRMVASQRSLLSPGRFAALLTLRALVCVLAVFFLARPLLETRTRLHRKDHVAFLIDESGSMGVRDGANGNTRLEQALEVARSPYLQKSLGKHHDVRIFRFSTGLREGWPGERDSSGAALGGGLTDTGQAIIRSGEVLSDRPLSAMVLFSDGGNNFGEDPLIMAKLQNTPIFPVALGSETPVEDIGISSLELPDTVYLGGQIDIKARLVSKLQQPRSVTLRILEGKREVLTKHVDVKPGNDVELEFSLEPGTPGLVRYTLECDPFPGEPVSGNNRRSAFVRVLADKIKVLVIASHLSWDFTFLKRTLQRDRNIDVRCLVHLPGTGLPAESTSPGISRSRHINVLELVEDTVVKHANWPDPEKRLRDSQVVFLYNLTAEELPPQYARGIKDLVGEKGEALVLLGGPFSFSAGGFHHSPLKDLVPVALFEAPDYRPETFTPKPTPAGLLHPVTSLVESATMNKLVWNDFPSLLGLNFGAQVKRGATVLLERAETEGDPRRIPVAVLGRWGQGKVLALCFEGFWKWDLPLKGFSGKTDWHQRFWTQAVRYLCSKKERGAITLKTNKKHFLTGEDVHMSLSVSPQPESSRPPAGRLLKVWPGETREIQEFSPSPVQGLPGQFRTRLNLPEAGEYLLEVTCPVVPGETGRARVLAEIPYREYENLSLNRTMLEDLATSTGGEYLEAESAGSLARLIEDKSFFTVLQQEREIWNSIWLLLIFVMLISAEWIIRKREGLE